MPDNESILEKVIATQIKEEKEVFNPKLIVEKLAAGLPDREKNVIYLRHGLQENSDKYTLEDIGKIYNITRERVRQIEVSTIKLMKKNLKANNDLNQSLSVVEQIIKDSGGVIENSELIDLVKGSILEKIETNFVVFFLELIKDQFLQVKDTKNIKAGWQLPGFNLEILENIISQTEEIVKKADKLFSAHELWLAFKNGVDIKQWPLDLSEEIFLSFIRLSKKLKVNPFNDWGLKHWNLITPRRMNDKIYLVLKHNEHPLHFREIAKKINEANFDGKKAHAATIHNELILDHNRYVLIGRGIYALKEWGYKPGVVADVIEDIIKQSDQPLNKNEIIAEVLKKRLVKDSTIVLALMNKKRFTKNHDGTYKLAQDQ